MSQSEAFQPTEAQRRLADCVANNPGYKNIPELCEMANVGVASYYRWARDHDFRDWIVQQWSSAFLFEGMHVINLARAQAETSLGHLKLLFKLLFDDKGLAGLTSWQWNAAMPPDVPQELSGELLQNQSPDPADDRDPAPAAPAVNLPAPSLADNGLQLTTENRQLTTGLSSQVQSNQPPALANDKGPAPALPAVNLPAPSLAGNRTQRTTENRQLTTAPPAPPAAPVPYKRKFPPPPNPLYSPVPLPTKKPAAATQPSSLGSVARHYRVACSRLI